MCIRDSVIGGPGPGASVSPSPSPSAAPSVAMSSPSASPITPFTLTIDKPFAAKLDFAATSDFQLWGDIGVGGKGWYKYSADPPKGIGVTVWSVTNAKTDVCGPYMDPPLGPSVDDLADVLVKQAFTDVLEDSPVTLDGYSGRYLDYMAGLSDCLKFQRWATSGGVREALNGEHDRVWILDVNGARVVIDAFDFPDASEADRAAIRAIVESVQISPN